LPNGILVRQVVTHELLVDHRYADTGSIVGIRKKAALLQPDAVGLEIIWRHHAKASGWALRRVSSILLALDRQWHSEARAFQRHAGCRRGALDARRGLDAAND